MIICIDMSRETKELMDSFVGRGDYRDYAELLESAVMNLSVLRAHMTTEKALVLDASPKMEKRPPVQKVSPVAPSRDHLTPDLFRLRQDTTTPTLATLPDGAGATGRYRPQDWLFGQYNKILPVKATVRALRALLQDSPDGIDISTAGTKITDAAVTLRQMLVRMDESRGSAKGDSLAAGFPGSEEKARSRFVNQFVGYSPRSGGIAGFPAELKLVGVVTGGRKGPLVSLTQAGLEFSDLENPILDRSDPAIRLSGAETTFLLRHIATSVPMEWAAFLTVLRVIANGSVTPDDLDAALRELIGTDAITQSHLATQRAGAVARMSDLGLIGREKSGLFVRYFVSDAGSALLESARE